MKRLFMLLSLQAILFALVFPAQAQDNAKPDGYIFKEEKRLPATPVKDQFRSGTCWSFAGLSFVESELLRMGKGTHDLSEMFVVYHTYLDKARKYVRLHGSLNMGAGGAAHDVLNVMAAYGIVPEEVFDGKNIGQEKHVHAEMDEVIKSFVETIIKNPNRELTPAWFPALEGILKAYLGNYPTEFTYQGKKHTPKSFATSLGFNPGDYVSVGSFTHQPYYSPFIIEIPDNWAWGSIYNLPLDEFTRVADHALDKGFTIAWTADVGEKGFSWGKGIAIVPEMQPEDLSGTEQVRWATLTDRERNDMMYRFDKPGREKLITPELRQKAFDNHTTTDDHLMHIIGKASDQNGNPYYIVKNSWEPKGHIYEGYMYASRPYFQYKSICIMVHKSALPDDIAKKLGIKK